MVNFNYLYNHEGNERFNKNYFVDKKLSFSVIENGILLPYREILNDKKKILGAGGIVDNNGEFIKSSSLRYGKGTGYYPPPRLYTAPKPLYILECFITFGGTP